MLLCSLGGLGWMAVARVALLDGGSEDGSGVGAWVGCDGSVGAGGWWWCECFVLFCF